MTPLKSTAIAHWSDDHIVAAQVASPFAKTAPPAPVSHPSGCMLVGDVRLDNREQLLAELRLTSAEAKQIDDRELVLYAYHKWGQRCPDKLYGDFAFAIWDANQKHLFAARDAVGVQPFYYTIEGTRIVFSPYQGAVRAALSAETVNWQWVADHLFSYSVGMLKTTEATVFAKLQRLLPGHALLMTPERKQIWAWWQPHDVPSVQLGSQLAYAQTLRELLEQAVATRLPSEGQVGAHLSGGLGSSAVTVLAARQLQTQGRKLPVYFWGDAATNNQYLPDDERKLVKLVCEQEALTCHYISPTVHDLADWRLRTLGGPPMGSSVRERLVQDAARASNVSVLLAGLSRNPYISGENLPPETKQQTYSERLRQSAKRYRRKSRSVGKRIYGKLAQTFAPSSNATPHGQQQVRRQHQNELVWHPDIVARLPALQRHSLATAIEPQHLLDCLQGGIFTQNLESWAIGGWENGIQYRYPLLDRRVLEFNLGVPPEMRVQDGYPYSLIRYALTDCLPEPICWRRSSLEPAVHQNRQQLNAAFGDLIMRPHLEKLLAESSHLRVLNREAVEAALERVRQQPNINSLPGQRWWFSFLNPYKLESLLMEASTETRA
ncbi:MAG: asparagine synthase-related protein [Candidatus Promineifilaceae bacterium]